MLETIEAHEARIRILEERDRRGEQDRQETRETVAAIFKRLERMDRGLARICGKLEVNHESHDHESDS